MFESFYLNNYLLINHSEIKGMLNLKHLGDNRLIESNKYVLIK